MYNWKNKRGSNFVKQRKDINEALKKTKNVILKGNS